MSNNEWSDDPGMTALRYILETMIHDRDSVEGILRHVHDEVSRMGDLMEQDWLEKQREWDEEPLAHSVLTDKYYEEKGVLYPREAGLYPTEEDAAEFLRLNPTSDASFMRAAAEAGVIPVYKHSTDVRSFGETEPF